MDGILKENIFQEYLAENLAEDELETINQNLEEFFTLLIEWEQDAKEKSRKGEQ